MHPLRLISSNGSPIEVEKERVLIGREPACDVVLDDKSVSRRHVLVERRGTRWHVTDQGSANGTFVDGQQITEADLFDGQELRLGTLSLWVQIEEEMPQTVLMAPGLAGEPPATTIMPSPVASGPPARAAAAAPAPAVARAAAAAPSPVAVSAGATAPSSPREDAAALLGLPVTASRDEVGQRYQELARDLQDKLDSARTPNLKATYERNLDEIRRAGELLAPGLSSGVSDADLPIAQPMVVPDAPDSSFLSPSRPAVIREAPMSTPAGPSTLTTTASAIVVIMLGLSGYFALSRQKNDKNVLTLQKSSDLATARADFAKFKPFAELEQSGALKNGQFKICNKGSQALEIPWLGAVYIDDKDPAAGAQGLVPKTFNSDNCRQEFHLSIPPGAEENVSISLSSEKCRWNGEGLFYSMAVRRPAAAPAAPASEPPRKGRGEAKASVSAAPEPLVFLSGLLNNRQDCVTIGEGW